MKTESDYLLTLCEVVANMKKECPVLNNFAIFGNVLNSNEMELLAVEPDIKSYIYRIGNIDLSDKSKQEIKEAMQLAITNWHDTPNIYKK